MWHQSSYRLHEYFSVARGESVGDKNLIHINSGAVYHFCGKAERVKHGMQGTFDIDEGNLNLYQDFLLNRSDNYKRSEQIIIPESNYDPNIKVGDGDKLYLKYSAPENTDSSPFRLPIVNDTLLVDPDYRGQGRMEINYIGYKDFTHEYSVETEYLDSFESSDSGLSFNFLIAEFTKAGSLLIKKQIHSGIIFLPRIFRMNENVS